MVQSILVLGGGSAGLLAALCMKRKMPNVAVTLVRSREIGIIKVGESTTMNLPFFLFDYLGISRRRFYELANPTWKLGIHFIWGPRKVFDYTFEPQFDVVVPGLQRPPTYYCDEDMTSLCQQSALVEIEKAFPRMPHGGPGIKEHDPFHLDNPTFVRALEQFCRECGVVFIDGNMEKAERGPQGIAAIHMADGQRLAADFFIDSSGFRSELLGKALGEPFISYSKSLFNDRAIIGSWDRTSEVILPYTTAETMECGWCWRIEHETHINRGYVYSSAFISDDEARNEFLKKNPKAVTWDHALKFRTGRYERAWVDNVMAIGNASGFVEPLESSALMMSCLQCQRLAQILLSGEPTPSFRAIFNRDWANDWDELRDFLTLHFWSNTLLQNPYWHHCQNESDISTLKPLLQFHEENGPHPFAKGVLKGQGHVYGVNGFLVFLVAGKLPYNHPYKPTDQERQLVEMMRSHYRAVAQQGLSVKEALQVIRHPNWRWKDDP